MILPYTRIAKEYKEFSKHAIDDYLKDGLEYSATAPCYLQISTEAEQLLLFFRDRQIYNAGRIADGSFEELSIKDFLYSASAMGSPSVACYEVGNKILHTLLIVLQKKPALKLSTSIVDLDHVLDKIEEEGRSCIVLACHGQFVAMLRYEKGEATALCHEQSKPTPNEGSFREDFLVKIYTLSAKKAIAITVYEDLLVKFASDAKSIDADYEGDITHLYLSKPPVVTLEFKNKEIGQWIFDRTVLNIGRTADNDIVVDNLAVSRLHAVLERDKGEYHIRDCDSLNGTQVNGQKIGRKRLEDGDEIIIGKHRLKFRRQAGKDSPMEPSMVPFDQTVIIGPGERPPQPMAQPQPANQTGPRLIERTKAGEVVIEIRKSQLVFGKDENADVELEGILVAKQHAEITEENGKYVLRHLAGYRKVSVGGKPVTECVLEDNDEIKIGKSEFIFQK